MYKNPTISCYPEYGFIFSLVTNDYDPWILNNFLHIRLIPEWENFLSFDNHDQLLNQCSLFKYTLVAQSDINLRYDNIIEFIIESINNEKCIYIYYDRFYIKKLYEYNKFHFIHKMFIVGYDMENKELYICDNFTHGRYEVITCSFDEFTKAYYRDQSKVLQDDILNRDYNGDIIKYAIDLIERKNSTLVFADRYYIDNFNTKNHMTHELELNGYNIEKGEFYIKVNYSDECKTITCKFEELIKAYRKDPKLDWINDIGIISKNHNEIEAMNKFSIEQIIDGLENYICSKPTYRAYGNYKCYYGMDAMDYMLKYVTDQKKYMIRNFQLMYEHKVIMELRVRYLIDCGLILESEICIEDYIELKNKFLQLRNKAIKCSVQDNKKSIDHLVVQFQDAVDYDRECCLKLINTLKSKSIVNHGTH